MIEASASCLSLPFTMSLTETPFTIAIPDSELQFLKQSLELTRFPDELEDAGREYGAPLADIQRLTKHWKEEYLPKWREHEAKLNEDLPQFTRDIEIEGHGWPGSFLEVRKLLPLLVAASPDHPSFHVVAVSLPGYGFSDAPKKKGFATAQYAELGNKLMISLGYEEYVTQGGDWGYLITRTIAQNYGPKHSKAWHTNMPICEPPHPIRRPLILLSYLILGLSAKEKEGLARVANFQEKGDGYFKEQSTQPQTLGYSLADSPVGLLAWIYEKLVNWTDEYPWTEDEVLTWISIYWFSKAGPAASVRIYYEITQSQPNALFTNCATPIPVGHSHFPREIASFPRGWLKSSNLVFSGEHEKGGHFAAYEQPEALANDVRKMFSKGSPAFGVVPGKTGYGRLSPFHQKHTDFCV
ncbi:Alpha/Beta hydrolase protein [Ephemerocybe angulata]|uniref:Alpha/Beta hydrolase protein n=1 Tax=Ephemerocybe angulata TaxID=980116 RepID=A0A8H6M893_9AGAR|nr:Alpha/Beta hydrolase protein [Tulosesus angulatus]